MCDDLALVAAVGRAAVMAQQQPLVCWAVVALLGRARLGAVDLAQLTGAVPSVITRVINALRRVGVIDGDDQLAERWRAAKSARSAHAEAQARYRQRMKARKSDNIAAGADDDHVISPVITRDHHVINGDITRDHGGESEQKPEDFRQTDEPVRPKLRVVPDQEGKDIDNISLSSPLGQGEHASEVTEASGLKPAQARRMHWTTKLQLAAERILPADHYRELGRRLKQRELYGFIMNRAPLDPWVKTTFETINARLKEEQVAAAEAIQQQKTAAEAVRQQPTLPLPIPGGRVASEREWQPPPVPEMLDYRGEDAELLTAVGD